MMVWVSLRYIIIFLVQSFQIKDRFCMVRTGRHPMSCSAYDFIILVEWHLLVLLVLPLPCLIVTLPINVYTGQVLSRSNSPLTINGTATVVTVLGLADVGIRIAEGYTPFYADDRDNHIDIIMHVLGDATVLESTLINVTAFSQQPGLYNPGGPGPFPFANVTYVAPAPEQTFRIDVDLNRTREVTYCIHMDNITISTNVTTCQEWVADKEMLQIEQGQLFPSQVNQLLFLLQNNTTDVVPTEPTKSPTASGTTIFSSLSFWSSATFLLFVTLLWKNFLELFLFHLYRVQSPV